MDGFITIGTKLDTKEFDQQILQVERRINEIEKELSENKEIGFLSPEEINALNLELEKTKNKLVGLYNQKMKLQKSGGFKEMNTSLNDAIKKAGKLALGIFSIRSAYMLVRRAASDLASYDSQFGTNLEYIRWALTQAIAPILQYIVQLAGTLLSYIYSILNAWFGIESKLDLSVDAFQKMKKSASGVSSSIKEIKKDLLGFDEINRLTSQGTMAGATGVGIPSFEIGTTELPEWVKWIANNKETVFGILTALGTLKIASSVIEFVNGLGGLTSANLKMLKIAAGLTLAITGITLTYGSIKKMLEGDLTSETLLEGLGGSAVTGIGAGLILGGPVGWVVGLALSIIVTATWFYEKNEDNMEKIAGFLGVDYKNKSFMKKMEFKLDLALKFFGLREASEKERKFFEQLNDIIHKKLEEIGKNLQNFAKDTLQFGINIAVGLMKGIAEKTKDWPKWIRDLIFNPFITAFKNIFQIHSPSKVMEELGGNIVSGLINGLNGVKEKVVGIFQGVWQGIQNVFSKVAVFFQTTFTNAWEGVKRVFSTGGSIFQGITEGITESFKRIVNNLISGINRVVVRPFNQINSALNGIRSTEIMGIRPFNWLPYISIPQIPYLKTGAIINIPNKGTLVGGGTAIAGESGREGVVPLTDRQAMEELGRTIGKYITVNANIVNTMNGRVISRELKQISNEQDFAYNT